MQKITLLLGGTSNERAVSLRSGWAVAKALEANGFVVDLVDPSTGLEKIDASHLVFSVLHGAGGEDGVV